MGTFVACRVKNCQHLNRLRHADEKRDYRPDADDSQLDTACRLGGDFVHDYVHPCPIPVDSRIAFILGLSNERSDRSSRSLSLGVKLYRRPART